MCSLSFGVFFISAEVCIDGKYCTIYLEQNIYSSSHDRDLVLKYEFSAKFGEKV